MIERWLNSSRDTLRISSSVLRLGRICLTASGPQGQRYVCSSPHQSASDLPYPPSQRFGNAVTSFGTLNLRNSSYAEDFSVIEEGCKCVCCRPLGEGGLGITRAFVHHVTAKETAGAHL